MFMKCFKSKSYFMGKSFLEKIINVKNLNEIKLTFLTEILPKRVKKYTGSNYKDMKYNKAFNISFVIQ